MLLWAAGVVLFKLFEVRVWVQERHCVGSAAVQGWGLEFLSPQKHLFCFE